jgi:hypothetical protein
MRTCGLFDQYRDRELNPAEERTYERHLSICPECQSKKTLIHNVAYALKQEEMRAAPDLSLKIAARAFSRARTWDSLVISWLRPGPALVALTMTIVLFSFLWIFMDKQPLTGYNAAYGIVTGEVYSQNMVSASKVREDNDLLLRIDVGSNAQ